jgi:hypothetical protein
MDEPTRFKKDSMKNAKIPYWLIIKRYWVGLAALSLTWFIYDFITYPVSYIFIIKQQPSDSRFDRTVRYLLFNCREQVSVVLARFVGKLTNSFEQRHWRLDSFDCGVRLERDHQVHTVICTGAAR